MVQQLPQFVDRVADVGPQHVFADELVEHLAYRALQEGDAAGMPGAVPGIGAVLRIVGKSAEKRWRNAVQIAAGLSYDVPRHKLGRVLEHVDEAVQLAQDVIGNMPRCLGLTVKVNGYLGIAE